LGSFNLSGISADIILSSSPALLYQWPGCWNTNICACGRPRFWNSMVYITATKRNNRMKLVYKEVNH